MGCKCKPGKAWVGLFITCDSVATLAMAGRVRGDCSLFLLHGVAALWHSSILNPLSPHHVRTRPTPPLPVRRTSGIAQMPDVLCATRYCIVIQQCAQSLRAIVIPSQTHARETQVVCVAARWDVLDQD
jgi:hypothetical protein